MHAKLSPPNASCLLVRERLHRILDDATGFVVWLIAPAGAGKTSLLATWTQALASHFIWYRVDHADRDPATAFEWFAQCLPPERRSALPTLQRDHLADLPAFAREYFRRWYRQAEPTARLVLENVHDAAGKGSSLATLLAALIAEKPAQFTLLLSSRVEQAGVAGPAPCADTMPVDAAPCPPIEVRYADLQFDAGEAAALANHLDLDLPPATLDSLADRADGWMAGLAMLLRHDASSPTSRRLVATESEVFGAFAGSAFDALPGAVKRLLLVHAFCPAIQVDSRRAGDEPDDAGAMLEALWQSQFFLERRESVQRGTEYVCHPLLQSFLQDRARRHWAPTELARLWRDQASQHDARGDWEAAFDLHLLAGDTAAATRQLLGRAATLHAGGRITLLHDLIVRLHGSGPSTGLRLAPPGITVNEGAADAASLAYWEALCLMQTEPAQALDCLRRAHAGHRAVRATVLALLDACAIIDAYFIQGQAWTEAMAWADEVLLLLDQVDDRLPDLLTEVRVIASAQALVFIQPDHPLVERMVRRAARVMAQAEDPALRISVAPLLIGYSRWRGDITAMRAYSRLALAAVDAAPDLPQSLLALVWIGVAASADGHACEPARRGLFERMLAQAERLGLHNWDFHAWINRAQEAMYFNDAEAAERAYAEALRCYPGTPGTAGLFQAATICLLQFRGEWEALIDLAAKVRRENPDLGGWVLGSLLVQLMEAQAQAMLGQLREAEATLAPVLAQAQRWDSAGFVMHGAFIRAHIALIDGQPDRADQQLREALAIARSHGYRHVHYWWSRAFFMPLLTRALEAGIEVDWVRRFILDQRIAAPAPGLARWPYRIRIQVFGPFRIEINGQPMAKSGRSGQRTLALIRMLAARGGTALATESLAADLWPDSDGDAAMTSLDITVLRARRLIGDPTTLLVHDGRIGFNPSAVDLDLWTWQAVLARIDAALLEATPDPACLDALARQLAPGLNQTLLAGEVEQPWLSQERQRWTLRFRHRAQRLARLIEAARAHHVPDRSVSPACGPAGR